MGRDSIEANSLAQVWVAEGGIYSILGSEFNEHHHQPEGRLLVFTVAAFIDRV